MAIYRCNACGFVAEEGVQPHGGKRACARCGTEVTVYDTVFFVEKLLERFVALRRELIALQQQEEGADAAPAADAAAAQTADASDAPQGNVLDDEDVFNTRALATEAQHAPLARWFAARQVQARFDPSRVDTSGFFDEAARALGERYDLFAELLERVRFGYRKSFAWVNLDLSKLGQKDAQAVNTLCRQLYAHTFFARYVWQKPEKIVRLNLQSAPAVRAFFEGGWLEWYALMEALQLMQARHQAFSCARGVEVTFPNEDLHELDVVLLPEGKEPICIECKSGEFRRDIEKYLRLKKRLGLDRSRFIICASDLSADQAAGLAAMYELSFVDPTGLRAHLGSLV